MTGSAGHGPQEDGGAPGPAAKGGVAIAAGPPSPSRSGAPLALLVAVVVAAYGVVFSVALRNDDAEVFSALVIGLVLVLLVLPVAYRIARRQNDPTLVLIITAGLLLKLLGAVARYFVLEQVYVSGDANRYHTTGAALAESFRNGDYSLGAGELIGTKFIMVATGVVYSIIGPAKLGGFLVFAWLAFIGQLCFYLAFRTGVPHGDHRRYALLVLFLPSLLFWPSSIGKDSWMVFCLGVGTLGAARALAGRPAGLILAGAGVIGTAMVRPHVAVLLLGSFAVAVARRRQASGARSALTTLGVAAAVVVGAVLLAEQLNTYLVTRLGTSSVSDALEITELRTGHGGSSFSPTPASVTGFPLAVVTVLFRPFPFEAHNREAFIASLDGVLMLGIVLLSVRRLTGTLRHARRFPLVAMCVVYSAMFIFGFSSFANFGLLARQRVQVLPFFLMLLALPARRKGGQGPTEEEVAAAVPTRPRADDRVRVAVYGLAVAAALVFALRWI